MNSRAFLPLLLSAIWILGGSWWYNKNYASAWCAETATPPPAIIEKVKDPLMFEWSNPTTKTYDKFPGFKSSILAGNKDGQILEITGRYFEGEKSPAGYANMGLARAEEIRKLFPTVPDTRIRMKAEMVTERDGVRKEEFTSAGFNWLAAPKEAPKVIETANSALIYFDFRATRKKVNKEVDDYLKKVSARLTADGNTEKVVITGHTDNKGEDASNQALGLRRAKTVRDILIRYGVKANRITTKTMGESQPVESNDTDAGRALNRRAEVRIIQ